MKKRLDKKQTEIENLYKIVQDRDDRIKELKQALEKSITCTDIEHSKVCEFEDEVARLQNKCKWVSLV